MNRYLEFSVFFGLMLHLAWPATAQTPRPALSVSKESDIENVAKLICVPKGSLPHSVLKQKPDMRRITLELHTNCQIHKFSLKESKRLWKHKAFKQKNKVVIFAAGWSNQFPKVRVTEAVARPYLCRQEANFIGINFDSYLQSINGTYTISNHKRITVLLSHVLGELAKVVPVERIHLIGHSLGAHIVSTAARLFRHKTGSTIPRVTALDPSKPCYPDFGMKLGDAAFIDVLHTNPDELGKKKPLGNVDFYFGGLKPHQPGCKTAGCSSHRAWQYFAETAYIGGNTAFQGSRCNSWDELVAGKCTSNSKTIVGYATNSGTSGLYVVAVHPQPPYGPNSSSSDSNYSKTCWNCQQSG